MQIIAGSDRSNLAIAEETAQSQRSKMLLHQRGIMARPAKQVLPPAIATEQAATINGCSRQFFLRRGQQLIHVFGGSHGIPALKLDGLARTRQGPHGNDAGVGVAPDQVAHQEVAPAEFLQIFVHHQTDIEVVLRLELFFRR